VEEFNTSLESAAADTPTPGRVSIIGLFAPDDLRIYREHNLYGKLTTQLGGEVVPSEAELAYDPEDNEVNYVSMEELGLASGDRLISLINVAPEADTIYRDLETQPLVQALPGFQNGQVLEADPQLAFGAAGVTGIQAMLDQLVQFYNS
jgi:ABC-type Fe3+-hydroxamate transport system substrate-binding protein